MHGQIKKQINSVIFSHILYSRVFYVSSSSLLFDFQPSLVPSVSHWHAFLIFPALSTWSVSCIQLDIINQSVQNAYRQTVQFSP